MTAPTDFVTLTRSDPVMAALRVLRDQLHFGHISADEFRAAYAELERGIGQPCDACLIGVAYIRRDSRVLCASCALGETRG